MANASTATDFASAKSFGFGFWVLGSELVEAVGATWREGSQIANADVGGPINQNYQNQVANWQQKQSGLGSLFGLGASLIASDRRLKTNIKEIGKTKDGQKIYSYRYKAGGPVHIGLMAQEVEKKHPDAVEMVDGFRAVDYGKALESV